MTLGADGSDALAHTITVALFFDLSHAITSNLELARW